MPNKRCFSRSLTLACAGVLFAVLFMSCSSNESTAKKLLSDYLKNQGTTDITVDAFFSDPKVPEKAYTSATVTYNFVGGDGKPQKEYLGFILARNGNEWRVERFESYTKDQQQAAKFLANGK